MVARFEPAVGTAQAWLRDLRRELGAVDDDDDVRRMLEATLHSLRDHLDVEDAAQIACQLPLMLRGVFYDAWRPAQPPIPLKQSAEFLQSIRRHHGGPVQARRVARAVFKVLRDRARAGEIEDLSKVLPPPLLELWPGPVETWTPPADREPTAADVMTRGVLYSLPGRSIGRILERMDEERVRHLLVVDSLELEGDGAPIPEAAILGLFSNRDLLHHLRLRPAMGVRLDRLRVRDLMTPAPLHTIEPLTPLAAAAERMIHLRVSAFPVLEGGKLVGMVTSEDLLKAAYPLTAPGVH